MRKHAIAKFLLFKSDRCFAELLPIADRILLSAVSASCEFRFDALLHQTLSRNNLADFLQISRVRCVPRKQRSPNEKEQCADRNVQSGA